MPDFKYIDAVDLPSDPNGSLGNLRTTLRRAYNENRNLPQKLALLYETLVVVAKEINEGFEREVETPLQRQHKANQDTINRAMKPTTKPRAAKRIK